MTERDEMIERAKKATKNGTLPDHTSIFEDFAIFAASEIARERERIGNQLHDLYMSDEDNAVTLLKMEHLAQKLLCSP